MFVTKQTGGKYTEAELFEKNNTYGIYQIDLHGSGRDYAFLSWTILQEKEKKPERKDYHLAYSDKLGENENLDSIYAKFNYEHPKDFTGHSLSISDIIAINKGGKIQAYYVDSVGYIPLTDFYEEKITTKTKAFVAEGHEGTWHTILMKEISDEKFFLMRHDIFENNVADILVNEQGKIIAEDLWNGFDFAVMERIKEYFLEKFLFQKPEVAFSLNKKGYFIIQESDEGYDYSFYTDDYAEIDGGWYDNPDVTMAEATIDLLTDEGIHLEDIKEVDLDDLEQKIEKREERKITMMRKKISEIDVFYDNVISDKDKNSSFYVAECMEFPNYGEYHEGLTFDEAIKIYERIPAQRLNAGKGIGIDLHLPKEHLYPGTCDLCVGKHICNELFDAVPFYKEHPEVQKAVKALEKYFEEKISLDKPKKQELSPRL